jgi:hypothetical protein
MACYHQHEKGGTLWYPRQQTTDRFSEALHEAELREDTLACQKLSG